MSEELKPCPFCGKDADIFEDSNNFLNIGCSDIDCIGSDLEWVSPLDEATELTRAIAAWNTRTAPRNEKD